MRKIFFAFLVLLLVIGLAVWQQKKPTSSVVSKIQASPYDSFPLSLAAMRAKSYPGSDLVIEQALDPESNYDRYIVSYKSDGLKILRF